MATLNINSGISRKAADAILAKGKRYLTVVSRGDNKGDVISMHQNYDLAHRAARNTDRTIVDLLHVPTA